MNLTLTAPALTPAQEVEDLCQRVPERFRLAAPQPGQYATAEGAQPYQCRELLVYDGLDWIFSGLAIQDTATDLQEVESTANAFEAVCRCCNTQGIMLMMNLNAHRGMEAGYVLPISIDSNRNSEGVSAYGRSMGEAGVLALSRALRVWGQG